MYLGIDIGTGSCKSLLYRDEGPQSSSKGQSTVASVEYNTAYLCDGLWVEQDPEAWWRSVVTGIARVTRDAGVSPSDIKGVGVSGHAPTVVAVDERGRPLRNAIIWQDRRSDAECLEIEGKTGLKTSPTDFEPKVLWLRNHEKEVFRETRCFLHTKDYILHRLTGRYVMDLVTASTMLVYDRDNGAWKDIGMDFPIERIPPTVLPPWDVAGEIDGRAAGATGLSRGTPVVAGGIDAFCEALGAGVTEEGQSSDMTGTSTCITACSARRRYGGADLFPHVAPGRYLSVTPMSFTGGSLRWFIERFWGESDIGDLIVQAVRSSRPGAGGLVFLPYLIGERSPIWDPKATGAFIGITNRHTREDFLRAVLEGACFGIRQNLRRIESLGISISEVRAVGGGARSRQWLQMKADITRKRYLKPALTDGAPLGDALLAAFACGHFPSMQEAVRGVVRIEEEFLPRDEHAGMYDAQYETYTHLYPSLRSVPRAFA